MLSLSLCVHSQLTSACVLSLFLWNPLTLWIAQPFLLSLIMRNHSLVALQLFNFPFVSLSLWLCLWPSGSMALWLSAYNTFLSRAFWMLVRSSPFRVLNNHCKRLNVWWLPICNRKDHWHGWNTKKSYLYLHREIHRKHWKIWQNTFYRTSNNIESTL